MTKRDFFRVLIKLFGLYYFVQIVFGFFPSQLHIFFSAIDNSEKIIVIIYSLFVTVISLAILYFLIKNPDKIINLLGLDKNFDTEIIDVKNVSRNNLLILGIFVIGGLLIVENITYLSSYIFYEFRNKTRNLTIEKNNINLLISLLNVVTGILLIMYRKKISEKFD